MFGAILKRSHHMPKIKYITHHCGTPHHPFLIKIFFNYVQNMQMLTLAEEWNSLLKTLLWFQKHKIHSKFEILSL